jgi:pentatricopeptide repeat protein
MRRTAVSALLALGAALLFVPGALAGEDAGKGLVEEREAIIRAYGNSSTEELTKAYEEAAATGGEAAEPAILYRRAALAELLGRYDDEEKALAEILARGARAEDVRFIIEAFRAMGRLGENARNILPALDLLAPAERTGALAAIAKGRAWTKPSEELVAAVESEAARKIGAGNLILFAETLASWGRADEAVDALVKRAKEPNLEHEEMLAVLDALRRIGARESARGIAERAFAQLPSGAPAGLEGLHELYKERDETLSSFGDVAQAALAWDRLLDRAAAVERRSIAGAVGYAALLGRAGKAAEKAEVMRRLREMLGDGDSAALYAQALLAAGDAYSAEGMLAPALISGTGADPGAYFDLFDSVGAVRDPEILLLAARVYAELFPDPQNARMVSEYVRVLGDYRTADKLFAAFVEESSLGPQTRFNWEGNRLFAEYYLSTGRLEEGRRTALGAVSELLAAQGTKEMTRSAQPEKYVALFAKFGGVAELLDYCRSREKDLPGSVLLALLEREACASLGLKDEALEITRRIFKGGKKADTVAHAAEAAHIGRNKDAIALFEQVYPGGADALSKATDEDINHFLDAVPDNAAIVKSLINLYAKEGRWDDAERLFMGASDKSDMGSWVALGGLFEAGGQHERAARAFEKAEDGTLSAEPAAVGAAVRFFVGDGQTREAANVLSRRIAMETSYDAKATIVLESMPRAAAECAGYVPIGKSLAKGPLGGDRQIAAYYWRELAARAGMLRDGAVALAADREATAAGPGSVENAITGAPAAEAAQSRIPSPQAILRLAETELETGQTEEALAHIKTLSAMTLDKGAAYGLAELVGEHAVPAATIRGVAASANSAWPWTVRAQIADALLASGDKEAAAGEAKAIMKGGTYVGKALWAGDFFTRAGVAAEAQAALSGEHPALTIAAIDDARAAGDASYAKALVASAQRTARGRQYAALFRMEAARLSAGAQGAVSGGKR